ncbi:MAG TPA: DMT family transporter [Alphaproteobacteria bacterium]|nr:DMT family transporter [Alphaproteobacteria bacterium]
MPRLVAVLLLLACTMLWGFAFVAQKTAMATMGPLTFAGIRYVLAAAVTMPFAIWEYRRRTAAGVRLTRWQWMLLGLLSLSLFVANGLQQTGLLHTTVTNSGFLTSLYVLFTPLVAFLAVRARPHPVIYVGAPMAVIGIYFLNGATLDQLNAGDALMILGALFWGVQVFLLGTLARATTLPVFVSAVSFVVTGILSSAVALGFEAPSPGGVAEGWVEILYAGVLSTAVAYSLQAIGQQHVPPANAAIILSAESLFAAFGGALLLGERLPPVGYLGAALIFLAILMVEAIPALRQRRAPVAG